MPQHALRTSVNRIMRITGFACALAAAMAGTANAANRIGWVWGNKPGSAVPYAPDPTRGYNSAGGTILITPVSTGVYQVRFGKLFSGAPDDVQITAFKTNGYCMSGGWTNSGPDVIATVNCYDRNGTPANRFFTLLYQSRSAPLASTTKELAYLWADQPTAASYAPSPTRQYNSAGAVNTVIRNSVGNYTAVLPKLIVTGGDVQVTAYNPGPNAVGGPGGPARCKVLTWSTNADATFVNVLCFDNKGGPADEYFDLAYAQKVPFGYTGSANVKGAYAWANQEANPGPYITDTIFQFNGFGPGKLTSQRTGVGQYTVTIPGPVVYNTSNVLVTAYGAPNFYCNVVDWGGSTINVACYKQGGGFADSQFDVGLQSAN